MTSQQTDHDDVPEALRKIAANPRVLVRRSGPPAPDAKCVVYWMQRAERALDNPALEVAVEVANALDLPVVAYFSAISNFPHANLRHYAFLNQGLADIEEDLQQRQIGFIVRRPPNNSLQTLLAEVNAAMVIGDENPCREPDRWRRILAGRLRIPYWTVDADVVVPSGIFQKRMHALHIFKPKLYAELPKFLVRHRVVNPHREWKPSQSLESFPVREDVTEGWKALDRSVRPVESFTGGTHAALKRLHDFVNKDLAVYDQTRNHPEVDGTSRLSPYLHFGHIGPITIALAVEQAFKEGKVPQAARDSYISELIGWRELAVNFVKFTENYDSFDCAEPWARKTLLEHARDRREHLYSIEQLERSGTQDELWNAAQNQMVKFGWMHNYMRMYWAKKILEWSPNPAVAFDTCVMLNDRYFLDGRDPNGYAGIAWSIVGKFDRPWFERPIFGTIRYMSGTSTGKKFNSKKYIQKMSGDFTQATFWAQE
jgi:deoxyribodipyrimidine photo-lyase